MHHCGLLLFVRLLYNVVLSFVFSVQLCALISVMLKHKS